jgi:phosphohistidine phosphatase
MHLLVIRHAIAEDREEFARTGQDDSLRPLTGKGRRRMEEGARGLARLVERIELLATSPLTRAQQTADVVLAVYGDIERVETEALAPEAHPQDFLGWLRHERRGAGTVAAVGHEPSLSLITSWLMCGIERRVLRLKKGGACLLELPDDPGGGTATLLWSLAPGQLRALAQD